MLSGFQFVNKKEAARKKHIQLQPGHEVPGVVVCDHMFCSGGTCEFYLLH